MSETSKSEFPSFEDRLTALERWQGRIGEMDQTTELAERIGTLETSNMILLACIACLGVLLYLNNRP
jgi:hypothetical protein